MLQGIAVVNKTFVGELLATVKRKAHLNATVRKVQYYFGSALCHALHKIQLRN
jgi:hypothetical protein